MPFHRQGRTLAFLAVREHPQEETNFLSESQQMVKMSNHRHQIFSSINKKDPEHQESGRTLRNCRPWEKPIFKRCKDLFSCKSFWKTTKSTMRRSLPPTVTHWCKKYATTTMMSMMPKKPSKKLSKQNRMPFARLNVTNFSANSTQMSLAKSLIEAPKISQIDSSANRSRLSHQFMETSTLQRTTFCSSPLAWPPLRSISIQSIRQPKERKRNLSCAGKTSRKSNFASF